MVLDISAHVYNMFVFDMNETNTCDYSEWINGLSENRFAHEVCRVSIKMMSNCFYLWLIFNQVFLRRSDVI